MIASAVRPGRPSDVAQRLAPARGDHATTHPSASVTVRPTPETASRSWVTTTTVLPPAASCAEEREDRRRRSPSRGCRSAHRRAGPEDRWPARARSRRAAAARPRGRTAACRPGRRRHALEQAARACAHAAPPEYVPAKSIGSITFSATVSVGRSWKNWNTIPTLRPRHAREPIVGQALDRGPADRHAAGRGAVDAADHVEQRRLAASRPADNRNELAGLDRRDRCRAAPEMLRPEWRTTW